MMSLISRVIHGAAASMERILHNREVMQDIILLYVTTTVLDLLMIL
jgi:hypothetical protein